MKNIKKYMTLSLPLLAIVSFLFIPKGNSQCCGSPKIEKTITKKTVTKAVEKTEAKKEKTSTKELPKLLDLGAKKCVPCKMMAPILVEFQKDYSDQFETEFIDVWIKENAAKAKEYKIQSIPTQIFFDKDEKELFRHTGYISKEDILKKWKELGYDFKLPNKEVQSKATK